MMKTGRESCHCDPPVVWRRSNPLKFGGSPRSLCSLAMTALFVFAKLAFAADIQISASLDRQQVAMGEQAVLNVTVSGNVSNLPAPQPPGLSEFQISNAGTSQSFSWVNGQASARVIHTYILTPNQVGKFTIPPFRLTVEGQTLETQPLPLEVVKGNAAAVPSPGASTQGGAPASQAPVAFVQGRLDKESAYVGEQITYSFRLYNRAAFLRQPQYQPPDTTGFWNEDLPPQRNFNESVKGVGYQVVEVRTALFPTHTGKATVGAATLNITLQNFSTDPFAADFFQNFFGGGQTRALRSDPVSVQVKALPSPAPAGFQGAVGDYALRAELDKSKIQVGQPLTLSLTVSGKGNIKAIPDIRLPAFTNFRTFDANAATNIEKKDYRVQGSKVFKTVLIPTASGKLSIPPVSFVYFNPGTQSYKTLTTKPIEIEVQPAAPGSAPAPLPSAGGNAPAPGIHVLNEDIHYIKTPATLSSQAKPLYRSRAFLAINGLFLLGLLGSATFPLYRKIALANPRRRRFQEAKKIAGQRIKEAEAALGRSDTTQASRSLNRALQGYLAAKLGVEESGLSLRNAADVLASRSKSLGSVEKVKSLWNTLDRIQFAPAQTRAEDLRQSVNDLRVLITELDKELKWNE